MALFWLKRNTFDWQVLILKLVVFISLLLNLYNEYYLSLPEEVLGEKNNMFLFHIFTFLEGSILIIYYRLFFESKKIKILVLFFLVGFVSLCFSDILLFGSLKVYPSVPRTGECILIILLSVFFFINLFNKSEVVELVNYPHFWMVSGYLLFFAGTFFMNIVGRLLNVRNDLGFNLYDIYYYLNIFLNIIYTITLWLGSRKSVLAQ